VLSLLAENEALRVELATQRKLGRMVGFNEENL
jgi:hypothetical protein